MYSYVLLLAPLASLLQLGAALPTEQALKIQKLPTIPLNETAYWAELQAGEASGSIAKRDTCYSETPYTQSDLDALVSSLQNDGQTDYLPAGSSTGWSLGTAVVSLRVRFRTSTIRKELAD